jgi:hypothetical protein
LPFLPLIKNIFKQVHVIKYQEFISLAPTEFQGYASEITTKVAKAIRFSAGLFVLQSVTLRVDKGRLPLCKKLQELLFQKEE